MAKPLAEQTDEELELALAEGKLDQRNAATAKEILSRRDVLNPRQFLDQYVMPCVRDWQLDPLNVRKAVIAISQIDILADHVIIHQHPGFTRVQLANVRKATEQNSPIRRLVRDVHDTHKHGPLQRPTATITTGERLQNNVFQVGAPVLEIVQDDGTKHFVENVINDALTYWEGELTSLEL